MFAYDPNSAHANVVNDGERSKSNIASTRQQRESIRDKVVKDQIKLGRTSQVRPAFGTRNKSNGP